ncbi:magnesium transporter [Legionella sp. CNM-4043-24]|uniref:magnesium transporter n=1 Tax=Legionella sp. CNM-4043-24 TaxID=3421646 RepID=UPI00403B3139
MTNEARSLAEKIASMDTRTAIESLDLHSPAEAARLLAFMPPARANSILAAMTDEARERVISKAPEGADWMDALRYPEGSVGRLLEVPPAVFRSGTTIESAIESLRDVVKQRIVTYLFVVDEENHLLGVLAFRELLYAEKNQKLDEVMSRDAFALQPATPLVEAMKEVVTRHYPVYPVCEADGTLVGQVRGQVLFEQQAFEISAQAGSMVGVEREERLSSPLMRSFKFRHPWLQVNLLTAFVAAAVVAVFEETIGKIIVLAMFLPVLGGQSGNLGCQAMSVLLRGMTLGELKYIPIINLIRKEAILGLINGLLTGALAGVAMYIAASKNSVASPLGLAVITTCAMSLSCMLSGIAGTSIPLILKRLGADPATASSIFLTTITDVVSMGTFLGLCTLFLI